VPVNVPGPKEFVEVEKMVEKPTYIREFKEKVKEVDVVI
jgi:hypothetical protein